MNRVVNDIEIYILSDRLIIKRTVAVWNAVALNTGDWFDFEPFKRHLFRYLAFNISKVPHLNKHRRKTFYRRAFDPYTIILPMTVRIYNIEVFIRNIISARISDSAVNYGDLSVIPVIHKQLKQRISRVKSIALDSFRLEHLNELPADKNKGTDIIV